MDPMELIGRYKNNAANIVFIIICLIVAGRIHSAQNQKNAAINERIKTESSRNTVLADISRTEKQLGGIKKLVNKKDMNTIVPSLQMIARDNSITVVSLKPQPEKTFADYVKYTYDISITGTYHTIGKFVSKIESSPDVYFVEGMNFRSSVESKDKDKKDILGVDMRISTIKIKE